MLRIHTLKSTKVDIKTNVFRFTHTGLISNILYSHLFLKNIKLLSYNHTCLCKIKKIQLKMVKIKEAAYKQLFKTKYEEM